MNKLNKKTPSVYGADAMTGNNCLVCGEKLDRYSYIYLGKSVCRECVDYIRSRH